MKLISQCGWINRINPLASFGKGHDRVTKTKPRLNGLESLLFLMLRSLFETKLVFQQAIIDALLLI